MTAAASKAALRARVRAARAARPAGERAAAAAALAATVLALPELEAVRTVAAYVSVGDEPGTAPLLDALWERGVEVLLPVLAADGDLDWGRYAGRDALVPAARGLLEPGPPLGREVVADAGLVVVPALAVDRRGHRLGRGGGAYDRALRRVPAGVALVALVHDDELLDDVPVDAWDRDVTIAATPGSGAVRLD